MTDLERLKLIVRTFRECNEEASPASVRKRFWFETRRDPSPEDLKEALS